MEEWPILQNGEGYNTAMKYRVKSQNNNIQCDPGGNQHISKVYLTSG